jgi:hypothetical protein
MSSFIRRGDIIIIRNGAKTISLQTLFGRLNNNNTNKKWSKNNKSPNVVYYLGRIFIYLGEPDTYMFEWVNKSS